VSSFKYITIDPAASNKLSRTANAIMLLLYFSTDDDNLIDKARFIRTAGLKLERRTWNKYWTELEEKGVLVRIGIKSWMLSPYQCYAEGRSHKALAATWSKLISHRSEMTDATS
tara:strand:+ start:613 stop:954 length:342 start_codon:yes stop_codon:yes gene_type:complete